MSKKEELAEQYRCKVYEDSSNRKRCKYNNELIQWNNEIVDAFEDGWDAAKQKTIECLKTILSLRSDVHPVVSKHIIELVEREMEE